MRMWQVQDARARFSELLEAGLKDGPQVVTRRGVEMAVLVPIGQWRPLRQAAHRPRLRGGIMAWVPDEHLCASAATADACVLRSQRRSQRPEPREGAKHPRPYRLRSV